MVLWENTTEGLKMNSLQTKLCESISEEPMNAMESMLNEERMAYLEHIFVRAGKRHR